MTENLKSRAEPDAEQRNPDSVAADNSRTSGMGMIPPFKLQSWLLKLRRTPAFHAQANAVMPKPMTAISFNLEFNCRLRACPCVGAAFKLVNHWHYCSGTASRVTSQGLRAVLQTQPVVRWGSNWRPTVSTCQLSPVPWPQVAVWARRHALGIASLAIPRIAVCG